MQLPNTLITAASNIRHMRFNRLRLISIASMLLLSFSNSLFAQTSTGPKTLIYHYDALGRLTFSEDSVNGNRDYDYDKAGNRLLVRTGVASDDAPNSSAPSSLGARSSSAASSTPVDPASLLVITGANITTCCSPGVYRATWNAVPTATYYNITKTNLSDESVTVTEFLGDTISRTVALSVQACNAESICGERFFFKI
jgi:YD repeat-containing protein